MFGAIYTGLSGLQAYSQGLQKVGNNVANLNSTGFKSSTITFSNLQAARDSGGISLQEGSGGGGQGVGLATSAIDFRAGELRQTGRDLGLGVDGNGFLVLMKGDQQRYIRTGSFEVDDAGFVVLSGSDWRLATLDETGRAVSLSVDKFRTDAPVTTSKVTFSDTLSTTATTHTINSISVYDPAGKQHVWKVAFSREESSLDWKVKVTDELNRAIGEKTLTMAGDAPSAATEKLTFADAENHISVEFDFSGDVNFFSSGTVSTLRASAVDGHGVGSMTTLAVNADGVLELTYSNGEKKQLGAVALASFRNPQELIQETSGLFSAGDGADAELLASSDPRVGLVKSQRLEASNVDLSKEFGEMILIQRGYQASSQIVSVSNDMIQQLFTIRGQG